MARDTKNKKQFIRLEEIILKSPKNGPTRNTAINVSKIEYVDLNANPILGCSHACQYCYARKIDLRFRKVQSEKKWHKPLMYSNFFELLEKELQRGKVDPDREIFLSTMTDLYQPYSIKYGIGRKLILLLQEYYCKYRILTKSQRIVEDKEILTYDKGKVGLSITTDSDNEVLRKYWEPRTVSIHERLEALKKLNRFGNIPLWVSAEPFLPATDFDKYYQEIITAGGNSLQEIIIGKMNYETGVDNLFNWEEVVRISEEYRHKYKGKIRFHYKKEFWNYLSHHKINPVDLKIANPSDFCF